ncbi:MAG: hypothetical protein WCK02_10190 [Bacteroidota bacterium]
MKSLIFLLVIAFLYSCQNTLKKESKEVLLLKEFIDKNKLNYSLVSCDTLRPFFILTLQARKTDSIIRMYNEESNYIDSSSFEGKERIICIKNQIDSLKPLITKADSILLYYSFSAKVNNNSNNLQQDWHVMLNKKTKTIDTILFQVNMEYKLFYPFIKK